MNQSLLREYRETRNENVRLQLDTRFKSFYFKVKTISYLSKLIHFEAIHFDQKIRQNHERFSLILDKNVEGSEIRLIDLIEDNSQEELSMNQLEDYITDEKVYSAVSSLTNKQKRILYLMFVKDKKEKEISSILGISQQAVSKQKKAAIKKIRERLDINEK
ncbi:sigma-70 family RNA polymerase sigma factor [Bacillus xiapuensis]|uniref:sigma-70 family RNA polymerase sigma factor n=1 Tax=Bacillus xiapuensis TaxID=2014075 RepID=UPI001E2CA676|nr:sigma-70 family RNA polymerase sigma factor [Bacillus xiapuensis]